MKPGLTATTTSQSLLKYGFINTQLEIKLKTYTSQTETTNTT